jgi:serine/threonine protein kinase
MIKFDSEDMFAFRPVIREISILRQLTHMKENLYTTKLHEIITPPENEPLDRVFLVMDAGEYSLREVFNLETMDFNPDHVVIILYNLLCALNFIHTAGIMHRDLKPASILINTSCVVTICDFGLARTVNPVVKEIEHQKANQAADCSTKENRIIQGHAENEEDLPIDWPPVHSPRV